MPNARARCATSTPTRPRPTIPSVLPLSSTPSQRLRFQRPAFRSASAWGTLRAWASSSAIVCSAADSTFDCGALTTITPRRGRRGDVDVVEADTGPADDDEVASGVEHFGGDPGRAADHEGGRARDRLEELLGRQCPRGRRPRSRRRATRRGRGRRSARRRARGGGIDPRVSAGPRPGRIFPPAPPVSGAASRCARCPRPGRRRRARTTGGRTPGRRTPHRERSPRAPRRG